MVDCKGGTSVRAGQVDNYKKLTKEELSNYIRPYDFNQYTRDVCIVDFQKFHSELARQIHGFPFLTIAPGELRKTGTFVCSKLDSAFAKDVVIPDEMVEPRSYYPFSETDPQGVVVEEVIRAWVAILQDIRRKDLDVFARETYANTEVMKTIHRMYDFMGQDHKEALANRIWEIVRYIRKQYPDFYKQVIDIQNARFEGLDISVRLANLKDSCQRIIEKEEESMGLEAFWPEPSRRA